MQTKYKKKSLLNSIIKSIFQLMFALVLIGSKFNFFNLKNHKAKSNRIIFSIYHLKFLISYAVSQHYNQLFINYRRNLYLYLNLFCFLLIKRVRYMMIKNIQNQKSNLIIQKVIIYQIYQNKIEMGCQPSKSQLKEIKNYMKYNNEKHKAIFQKILQPVEIYQNTKPSPQGYLKLSSDLENLIKRFYETLIKQKLKALQQKQILSNDFKNQLSWNIVLLNLTIMEKIVNQSNFIYDGKNFKSLQIFQKNYVQFLKKQYPRGDKVDAGELSRQFKQNIDFTDEYQNNLLNNFNLYFISEDGLQIKKTIKKLINKLIDETEYHYSTFDNLVKNYIFKIPEDNQQQAFESKDVQNEKKTKSFNFSVGRKISQNTSMYKRIDKDSLQISSNQIFRILIKWIQDLRQTIQKPQQKILLSSDWTFVKLNDNADPQLIKCEKIYRQMLKQQGLFQEIKKLNQETILNQSKTVQEFYIGLITLLSEGSKNNIQPRHLSKQEAKVIKFCDYNMSLYKQIVEQELIRLIQVLVKASVKTNAKISYDSSIKGQNTKIALSLIKFKVSDLLRCKFQGNRKQIRQVYQNFLNLQSEGTIKILKIKNRFHTDLSDAIISFKIKDKFANNNNKNEQTNQKIENYLNIFKFFTISEQKEQSTQKRSCHFICQCQLILVQNSKAQNSNLKNVQTLNHYLYELERSQFSVLGEAILGLNYKYDVIQYSGKIKFMTLKSIQNCNQWISKIKNHQLQIIDIDKQNFSFVCSGCWKYYEPFQNVSKIKTCKKCFKYLCSICSKKSYKNKNKQQNISKQNKQGLKKQQKQTEQIQEFQIQILNKYTTYFFNLFNSNNTSVESINNETKIIKKQQPIQQQTKILTLQQVRQILQQIFYKIQLNKYLNSKNKIKVKQLILLIYKEIKKIDYQGSQDRIQFFIFSYSKNKVIHRGYKYQANNQKLINIQNQEESYQNHQFFQLNDYDTLFYPQQRTIRYRKNKQINKEQYELASYKFLIKKKNILSNQKLYYNGFYIFQIGISFNYIKHFKQLKYIDLYNNQIQNADSILENCMDIQYLILQKNKLQKIIINNPLISLQVLNLKSNKIKYIQGIQKLKCLKRLELTDNQIQNIFINNDQNKNQTIKFKFPFLTYLDLMANSLNKIQIIEAPKIQMMNLSGNQIQTFDQFFKSSFKNLWLLACKLNQSKKLGKINAPKLRRLAFGDNLLQDVKQFFSCNFEKLQLLDLQQNRLKTLPKLVSSSLKTLYLSKNQLIDVNQFFQSQFIELKHLDLSKNNLQNLQIIKAPKLQTLILSFNKLTDQCLIFQSQFNNLIIIKLQKLQLTKIPNLKANLLKALVLDSNNIINISSKNTQNTQKLPIICKYTKLQELSLKKCPISQINLSLPIYQKLQIFVLSIKAESQVEFNNKKQQIQQKLKSKVQILRINKYQEKN